MAGATVGGGERLAAPMNEADVRGFFDALGRSDFDRLDAALHDDAFLEFPGTRFGGTFASKRRVMAFLRANQRLFRSGLSFSVHWVGLVGDRAVALWTNSGITREGIDYANRGATVFVLRDGRIAAIHDYLDTETLSATWPEASREPPAPLQRSS